MSLNVDLTIDYFAFPTADIFGNCNNWVPLLLLQEYTSTCIKTFTMNSAECSASDA